MVVYVDHIEPGSACCVICPFDYAQDFLKTPYKSPLFPQVRIGSARYSVDIYQALALDPERFRFVD